MNIEQFSFQLIIGALIIGFLLQWAIEFFLQKKYKNLHFNTLNFKLDPLIDPLRLLIPALSVAATLPLLHLSNKTHSVLAHIVQLCVMASIGWLLTRIIRVARDTILHKYEITSSRGIYTQVQIVEHILDLIIWILTLALMIMTFSQIKEIGMSIFASAGIMGIVVGFAAQKTLGNVIAGIQIALAQPIRIEDAVIVEGEFGLIEEITLTYVVVRVWDLRRIVLPISYFIEKPFQNWTRTSSSMLGTVFLYVDYSVPVDKLREELNRILQGSTRWQKKVNSLQVTDMKEKTVELRALMDAPDSGMLWDLRCEVREKLLVFIQKEYPHAIPHLRINLNNSSRI